MSLILNMGTKPEGLEIKTYGTITGDNNAVHFGDYEISLEDFLCAANYVLTNTDLEPDDPRLRFIDNAKSMIEVNGFDSGKKRLKSSVSPVRLNRSPA